jgi:glycogen phosphorylase
MYEPIASQSDALAAHEYARARELATWKNRVTKAWPEVKVIDVNSDSGQPTVDLGGERQVTVEVRLGSLSPDDVAVELLHGPVVAGDELARTEVVRLEPTNAPGAGEGTFSYQGQFRCDQAGRHGYTVRIVPYHPDLTVPVEMGCVAWA